MLECFVFFFKSISCVLVEEDDLAWLMTIIALLLTAGKSRLRSSRLLLVKPAHFTLTMRGDVIVSLRIRQVVELRYGRLHGRVSLKTSSALRWGAIAAIRSLFKDAGGAQLLVTCQVQVPSRICVIVVLLDSYPIDRRQQSSRA